MVSQPLNWPWKERDWIISCHFHIRGNLLSLQNTNVVGPNKRMPWIGQLAGCTNHGISVLERMPKVTESNHVKEIVGGMGEIQRNKSRSLTSEEIFMCTNIYIKTDD